MDTQRLYFNPVCQALLVRRRRARAEFFLSKVRIFPGMSVLDIGCGIDGNSLEAVLPPSVTVVGIDLLDPDRVQIRRPGFTYYQQDAEDLSRFADQQFDLAVSVGMMEHICDPAKLKRIAAEMRRVSKQSLIVVPWKYAWIEPHFKFPFFQLLPWTLQLAVTRAFNCNDLRKAAQNPEAFRTHFNQTYQWLPTNEWKRIFGAESAYLSRTLETIAIVRR